MGQGAGASRHRARANARSTPAAPSASAAPRRGAGGETCRRPILSHEARKISGQPAKRHHRRRLAGHFAPNFMHTLSGPRRIGWGRRHPAQAGCRGGAPGPQCKPWIANALQCRALSHPEHAQRAIRTDKTSTAFGESTLRVHAPGALACIRPPS